MAQAETHAPDLRPANVLTVTGEILCRECGARVYRRDTDYCSPRCYDRFYNRAHPVARQRALPLTPPPAPVPPVRDQRVSVADRPRLAGHNLRVLERLKAGPATNAELAVLLGPASAWRTRVSDVRLWLERHEGMTVRAERCVSDGLYLYRLEAIR
jgi:uncharacterized protein YbjT (DUF2867 family)